MKIKPLSPQESECLYWVALGKTTQEIGKILGLSRHTVNFHIRKCLTKLNASNRPAAIAKALTLSLLSLDEPRAPRGRH